MKKYVAVLAALTLGLLVIVALRSGIGWAQAPGDDDPTGPWTSSAEIPEGVQIQGPPDQPAGVDAADVEAAATYNAYLRVAGSALRPRESNVGWDSSASGGCLFASSGDMYTVFNTPVYLPQGATVKYMRLYYNDTSASNANAWFSVYDLYGDLVAEWNASSSGNTGEDYRTTSEFTHTVDYDQYSYLLNWRPNDLGSDMQVCGFRLYYRAPPGAVYLPLVTKEEE
ncbi:MAG: hypothetical protein JXA09_07735 [Anaerolineae bacterium]|nr:hypothetical protein [Anaerolineae bacterium]